MIVFSPFQLPGILNHTIIKMFKQKSNRNPYLFSNKKNGNPYLDKKQKEINDKLISEQLSEYCKPISSYAKRVTSFQPLPVKSEFKDGWTYITKNTKTGKTDFYTHNPSSEYLNEPLFEELCENLLIKLNNNYERYKDQYEEIHGEGEYDLAFKFDTPIIFESDNEDEDEEEKDEICEQ